MIEPYSVLLSLVLDCQALANAKGQSLYLVYRDTGFTCSDKDGQVHNYTHAPKSDDDIYGQYFPKSIKGGLAYELGEPGEKGCRRRGCDRRELN